MISKAAANVLSILKSSLGTSELKSLAVGLIATLICATVVNNNAKAAYDANMSGQLEGFYVYTEADHIYLRLKNQPTNHAGCNPYFFVVPGTVPADRRKAIIARLSLAYALGESVNIGYAANGDCANGYIQVYRVG